MILNKNFDFNKFKAFYAVVKTGSFSKAAGELFVSQPSISYSIKELEKEFNCQLLTRNNKKIELTEKGQKLYYFIENIFDNLQLSYSLLNENKDKINGEIRIGMFSHISTLIIPNIIKEFKEKYPEAKFTIYSSTSDILKEKFRNNELDIIILHYPIFQNDDKFEEKILLEFESCFFSNKNYYDKFINKPNNKIIEFPLILPMKGFFTSNMLENIFKKSDIYLKSGLYVYTTELMIEMVKEGLGIGWGLKDNVLKNNDLYEIPLKIKLPKIEYSISYKKNTNSQTLEIFIQFLLNKFK